MCHLHKKLMNEDYIRALNNVQTYSIEIDLGVERTFKSIAVSKVTYYALHTQ